MRNNLGIVGMVVGLVAALTACGGPDTFLPTQVVDSMKSVESALEESDADRACQELNPLMNGLYEWQEFARGKQQMMVEQALSGLEGMSYTCHGEDTDIIELRDRYEKWSSNTKKVAARESGGFGIWFTYILVPLVVGGFLMFWRRKFREA